MNFTTLFISDSSITNPILYSQGLPFLERISKKGWKCFILSFEINNSRISPLINNGEYNRYISNKNMDFIQVNINSGWLVPVWLKMFLGGVKNSFHLIKKNNITIVHARSFVPALIAATLKFVFFHGKIKIVNDTRGAFINEWLFINDIPETSIRIKVARYFENLVLRYSDKIVVVSKFYKNYLLKSYNNSSLNDLKISCIPNRTYINSKRSDNDPKISQFTRSKEDKLIGIYSGSAAPWQGIDNLMEIARSSYNHKLKIRFQLITYESELLFKKYNLDSELSLSKIEIVSLNSLQTKMVLNRANFGTIPRDKHFLNQASSPLKFAEYLAAGLPILVGEGIGNTEEIILEHNIGVIIKNNNYLEALKLMIKLLEDKDIKKRCRFVAEEYFNIEDSFVEYEQIYETLLYE
jgi:glycosyltransferase involved in cell wall biosynthesis